MNTNQWNIFSRTRVSAAVILTVINPLLGCASVSAATITTLYTGSISNYATWTNYVDVSGLDHNVDGYASRSVDQPLATINAPKFDASLGELSEITITYQPIFADVNPYTRSIVCEDAYGATCWSIDGYAESTESGQMFLGANIEGYEAGLPSKFDTGEYIVYESNVLTLGPFGDQLTGGTRSIDDQLNTVSISGDNLSLYTGSGTFAISPKLILEQYSHLNCVVSAVALDVTACHHETRTRYDATSPHLQ